VLLGASTAPEAVAAPLFESATRAALDCLSGSLSAGVASKSVIELTSKVSRSLSMSWVKVAAIFCLTVCVGAAGFQVFARQKPDDRPPAAKAEPAKTQAARWRYQSVRLVYENELADKANEEGAKGWEVIEVVPVIRGVSGSINTQYTILFRRAADTND
jgi:hypothetical protein